MKVVNHNYRGFFPKGKVIIIAELDENQAVRLINRSPFDPLKPIEWLVRVFVRSIEWVAAKFTDRAIIPFLGWLRKKLGL